MSVQYNEQDRDQYLGYIGNDWGECLYLYLNFIGLSGVSPDVEAFICRDNDNICAVLLRYHNALHIFSRERKLEMEEFRHFVTDINPLVIWINENAFHILRNIFDGYCMHTLPVMSCSTAAVGVDTSEVTVATEADLSQIAALMLEDELYRSGYESADQIVKTFSERMRRGVGISYMIRIDGQVAAHASINAMAGGIAVYGALVVDRRYRGQGLAKKVRAKLMEEMVRKNITVFDFPVNEATKAINAAGGGKLVGNIIKLSKME